MIDGKAFERPTDAEVNAFNAKAFEVTQAVLEANVQLGEAQVTLKLAELAAAKAQLRQQTLNVEKAAIEMRITIASQSAAQSKIMVSGPGAGLKR